MAIKEMSELVGNGLERAVELMSVAAHNSYRFKDRNTVKMISVEGEDLEQIAEYCFSLGDAAPAVIKPARN